MSSVFSEQILADKLSKLNSTQQCIETLSHWCIFHRKNAEQVVQTWDKQFRSLQKEHKTSFLFLANDILQNSKRTGNEFVCEFWKVLPAAVKDVLDNGDEHGKSVVTRLVGIWEQRRVFGSRARGIKDSLLGSEPLPALDLNKKRPRSIRIIKRDSRSIRIKLSLGGTPEKVVSAFHTVLSEHPDEDTDLNICKTAVRCVGKMEKDVDAACLLAGDPRRKTLAERLEEEENVMKQCIEKLKSVESNRRALVSQLKEALQEQESELENVRTQLQVAQAQVEQSTHMRRRLNNEATLSNGPAMDPSRKSAAAIAAEVVDRLTASTHSQQIMTSVLSTFAAEEAKNSSSEAPKATRLERPVSKAAVQTSHQQQAVLVQQNLASTAQPQYNLASTPQPQYNLYSGPTQQYLQSPGGLMIGLPYPYTTLPPPPPPPPPQLMNLVRSAPLTPQQQQQQQQTMALISQQQQQQQQVAMHQLLPMSQQAAQFAAQQPAPPSYRPLQPPSMGFYSHQTQ